MNDRLDHAMRIVRHVFGMTDAVGRRSGHIAAAVALFPLRMPLRVVSAARLRWHRLVAFGETIAEVTSELAQGAHEQPPRLHAVRISIQGEQRSGGHLARGPAHSPLRARGAPRRATGSSARAALSCELPTSRSVTPTSRSVT
jgi:hypothetical protein